MARRLALLLVLLAATAGAQTTEECMDCHADPDLTTTGDDGVELSLHVDLETYETSIHGGFDCIDCHATIAELPHDEKLPAVSCAECHDDVQEEFESSIHAIATREGIPYAGDCVDCHGSHDVLPSTDPDSRTNPRHISTTCGHCHSRPEVIALFERGVFDPVADYELSVHGRRLHDDPEAKVATCVVCHGSHAILPPINPESSFSKFKVADTCGECHPAETLEFKESIHWRAVTRGFFESPVCNDCHTEHRIIEPAHTDALTHPSLVSSELCATCHSNKTMMSSFGLDAQRFESYLKTYHGLAVLRGSPDAANCVSCHEMHAIRPSSDERSATHPSNLEITCGKCHKAINGGFTQVPVHPLHQKERNPVAYWVKVAYVWLIVLTIGGMLVHNLIIHSFYVRAKWREAKSRLQVRRFGPFQVVQHILLFSSFFILVVTGFALKFPEAGWVKVLSYVGLTEAARSLTHRIAGGVLVTISLLQAFYLVFHRSGRRDVLALMPSLDDLRGVWQNLLYHLRLGNGRPRFGRFDYTEKAEYLALIWGTLVMAATGFILWFPEFFLSYLPVWVFETSEVIHYYEAWLATLAIIVWHWYFVLFHPENYPMNLTWLRGTMPKDDHEHHHPLEKPEEVAPSREEHPYYTGG